jgi:hypothetical protein
MRKSLLVGTPVLVGEIPHLWCYIYKFFPIFIFFARHCFSSQIRLLAFLQALCPIPALFAIYDETGFGTILALYLYGRAFFL